MGGASGFAETARPHGQQESDQTKDTNVNAPIQEFSGKHSFLSNFHRASDRAKQNPTGFNKKGETDA